MQNFVDVKKVFPSSVRPGGLTTSPRIAGLTLMLPFFEEGTIYDKYDQTKNWSDNTTNTKGAVNKVLVNTRLPNLQCPSVPNPERLDGVPEINPWSPETGSCSDYAATIFVDKRLRPAPTTPAAANNLVDEAIPPGTPMPPDQGGIPGHGLLAYNFPCKIKQVTDGLSKTIAYAESAGRPYLYRGGREIGAFPESRTNGGGWCRPASDISIDGTSGDGSTDVGTCAVNCANGMEFGSTFPHPYYNSIGPGEVYAFHPGGAYACMGDASVRWLNSDVGIRDLARLVTRNGSEINTEQ